MRQFPGMNNSNGPIRYAPGLCSWASKRSGTVPWPWASIKGRKLNCAPDTGAPSAASKRKVQAFWPISGGSGVIAASCKRNPSWPTGSSAPKVAVDRQVAGLPPATLAGVQTSRQAAKSFRGEMDMPPGSCRCRFAFWRAGMPELRPWERKWPTLRRDVRAAWAKPGRARHGRCLQSMRFGSVGDLRKPARFSIPWKGLRRVLHGGKEPADRDLPVAVRRMDFNYCPPLAEKGRGIELSLLAN